MRTKTMYVSLNTSAAPPVTVQPGEQSVGKHMYQLRWVPAPGQSGWVFADITQPDQTTPLPSPPFSTPSIGDTEITVTDDNKHQDDHGNYSYSICVKVGTTPYWSDPEIINKGGGD